MMRSHYFVVRDDDHPALAVRVEGYVALQPRSFRSTTELTT